MNIANTLVFASAVVVLWLVLIIYGRGQGKETVRSNLPRLWPRTQPDKKADFHQAGDLGRVDLPRLWPPCR